MKRTYNYRLIDFLMTVDCTSIILYTRTIYSILRFYYLTILLENITMFSNKIIVLYHQKNLI